MSASPRKQSIRANKVLICITVISLLLNIGSYVKTSQIILPLNKTNRCNFSHSNPDPLTVEWWNCPSILPDDDRYFRKSIFYIKPHKTGSESFKETLLHISEYYNLTNELNTKTDPNVPRQPYDVLIRHQRYNDGVTEKQLRGWNNGTIEGSNITSEPKRRLLRVVTIRDPIDRLFSHYFSRRRFFNFIPRRGHMKPGRLSEEEELSDFEEWLDQYPSNQQTQYLMNVPPLEGEEESKENEVMMQRVGRIVELYDHIVVAEDWKQSICLFGFLEKVMPQLLRLRKRNWNRPYFKRFDVRAALIRRGLFEKVLLKVKYDFILYQRMLQKYFKKLEKVRSSSGYNLQSYCAVVRSEQDIQPVHADKTR